MADVIATAGWCVVADVIASGRWKSHRVNLLQFKFWGVDQNLIPNMWQMVLMNIDWYWWRQENLLKACLSKQNSPVIEKIQHTIWKNRMRNLHLHFIYWSFIEKTSVKQDLKCKGVFKFSDNLSTPNQMELPCNWGFRSGWYHVPHVLLLQSVWPLVRHTPHDEVRLTLVQALGQTDLWSDVPPGRDI